MYVCVGVNVRTSGGVCVCVCMNDLVVHVETKWHVLRCRKKCVGVRVCEGVWKNLLIGNEQTELDFDDVATAFMVLRACVCVGVCKSTRF